MDDRRLARTEGGERGGLRNLGRGHCHPAAVDDPRCGCSSGLRETLSAASGVHTPEGGELAEGCDGFRGRLVRKIPNPNTMS